MIELLLLAVLATLLDIARTLRRTSRKQYTGSVLGPIDTFKNWLTFRRYE
jgi:hypothetical protein